MGHFPSAGTDATRAIGSLLTNPVANTEVVATGALKPGAYLLGLILSANAAAEVDVGLRNAADSAWTWGPIRIYYPANGAGGPLLVPVKDTVALNERYRAQMGANLTGSIQGGFWLVAVG